MKRAGLAALVAVLLLGPSAEAKLRTTFSERSVDAERFLSSLRVYLVPIEEAGTTKGQSSPHQRKVAEILRRAAGSVPRTFDFEVPRLAPGLYASEIWYRAPGTDWFENAGIQPRLSVRREAQLPRFPSRPPPPELPDGLPKTRPSLGCTSTQPCPANDICTDSPDPRPMKFFSLMSVLIPVCTLDAQVIAACGSAKVGASPVLSSTGGPSEMIATQPVPVSAVLNRPPPIIPLTPSTRLMSQSIPASNASRFVPFTVIASFSRYSRWMSWAVSARNTS